MPDFGDGSELEIAGPDNRVYLFIEVEINVKYNTQIFVMWFDVQ